jgi:hypothetical protein
MLGPLIDLALPSPSVFEVATGVSGSGA